MMYGEDQAKADSRFISHRSAPSAGGNISSDDSFVSPRGYASAKAEAAGYHSQGYASAVSQYSTDEHFLSARGSNDLSARGIPEEIYSARSNAAKEEYGHKASAAQYGRSWGEDEGSVGGYGPPGGAAAAGAGAGAGAAGALSAAEAKDLEDVFSYARHNRVDDLERLLDAGMPVNIRDQYGNTVLCVACQNGHKRAAKAALRRGADINARNYRGNTPLHFCFTYGYGETLGQYLISKGADPTIRNNDGVTCYEGIRK